jgi:translation initiation factor 4E
LSQEERQKQAEEREEAEKQRRSEELKKGLHPLQDRYVFWFSKRGSGPQAQRTSYEDTIKRISEFSTVEGFWCTYCHLSKPNAVPNYSDFHLFKSGIRPLWEDERNRAGGKWILRFNKKLSGRYWEELLLALVGDQVDYGDSVCGAVLSLRSGEDIISVWNRDASDSQATMLLRDSIKKHLLLPPSYVMEYKPHDASLKDHSSFRNTWLRG